MLDPPSGNQFLLERSANSPAFAALVLPAMEGVDHWQIDLLTNIWSDFGEYTSLLEIDLRADVLGLLLTPEDSAGRPMMLDSGFALGVRFAETGDFVGNMTVIASVPEPKTYQLLALALCLLIVQQFRRGFAPSAGH